MPQDIDALLNDYHSKRGTKRAEPDSSSPAVSDPGGGATASGEDSEGFWGGFGGSVGDFLKGGAKGLAGDVVGAGQLLRGAGNLVGHGGALEAIGQSAPAQAFANWAEAPSKSWAESAGQFAGGALPYVVGGPEAAIARGMVAGAIQPTKEGTLTSHIPGALMGAIPGLGSKGLHAAAATARFFGIPVPHAASVIKVLNMLNSTGQLGKLAASPAVKQGIAGAGGTAIGQAVGQQGNVYEEDYQPRYRPSSQ